MKYRYIPKGSAKVADKHSDAVAYVSESNGAYYAVVDYGEQSKPIANYRYRTAERRAEHVAQLFAARQAHAVVVAKRKAERKAGSTTTRSETSSTHVGGMNRPTANITKSSRSRVRKSPSEKLQPKTMP
jgi:hypothetical protein